MAGAETNVIAAFGVANLGLSHTPADVREFVNDLKAQMERGEIASIAVVIVRPNRNVATEWVCGTSPVNLAIAGASQLQYRLNESLFSEDRD